jgi:hypothetical protein
MSDTATVPNASLTEPSTSLDEDLLMRCFESDFLRVCLRLVSTVVTLACSYTWNAGPYRGVSG